MQDFEKQISPILLNIYLILVLVKYIAPPIYLTNYMYTLQPLIITYILEKVDIFKKQAKMK